MKKTFRKSRSYGTLREFAEALGKIPVTTLSSWIRNPKWKWNSKAPWNADIVPDVLRWAADDLETGRPRKDPAKVTKTQELRDEKLRQEIRKLRANADQAETALARERGQLHDADQCEEEAVRRATLIRNAMQNVPTQGVSLALSHGMPHEAAPQFQKQLEELVNGSLRYLASSPDAQPEDGNGAGAAVAGAAGTLDG